MLRCMTARMCAVLILALAPAAIAAESLAGSWDATVKVNGLEIPFRFEVTGDGTGVQGSFFNGAERLRSTSGVLENNKLVLNWDYYAAKLEANFRDGILAGEYIRSGSSGRTIYPFQAKRLTEAPPVKSGVPQIAGIWLIPITKSSKGELAWQFIVSQTGAQVSAAILRVDGDTGALTGSYRDGKFILSHFSGVRPSLLEVTPLKDGSLEILQNGKDRLAALRPEDARAKGLPQPTDPNKHTVVKDPGERFQWSAPDLKGNLVTDADPRFRGKVVLVNIAGSWCPNCHDETPFLVELYRKYHADGLEIVALSFEEPEQLKDPTRLRAFIKRYGIEYTVLLAGAPDEAKDKLTQAVNWNAWPTTFFLGRDGRVRKVHAGFPSSASGNLHSQAKAEFTAEVEHLLRENLRTAR
jgi:thiol-disulfide isomerase/thioredoxin